MKNDRKLLFRQMRGVDVVINRGNFTTGFQVVSVESFVGEFQNRGVRSEIFSQLDNTAESEWVRAGNSGERDNNLLP
jgi:hypothetical protein